MQHSFCESSKLVHVKHAAVQSEADEHEKARFCSALYYALLYSRDQRQKTELPSQSVNTFGREELWRDARNMRV